MRSRPPPRLVYRPIVSLPSAHSNGRAVRPRETPKCIETSFSRTFLERKTLDWVRRVRVSAAGRGDWFCFFPARRGENLFKVLDFGLVSWQSTLEEGEPRLTGEAQVQGTPAYLSPEAISAPNEIGPRSDVYALGCVAHCLPTSLAAAGLNVGPERRAAVTNLTFS